MYIHVCSVTMCSQAVCVHMWMYDICMCCMCIYVYDLQSFHSFLVWFPIGSSRFRRHVSPQASHRLMGCPRILPTCLPPIPWEPVEYGEPKRSHERPRVSWGRQSYGVALKVLGCLQRAPSTPCHEGSRPQLWALRVALARSISSEEQK